MNNLWWWIVLLVIAVLFIYIPVSKEKHVYDVLESEVRETPVLSQLLADEDREVLEVYPFGHDEREYPKECITILLEGTRDRVVLAPCDGIITDTRQSVEDDYRRSGKITISCAEDHHAEFRYVRSILYEEQDTVKAGEPIAFFANKDGTSIVSFCVKKIEEGKETHINPYLLFGSKEQLDSIWIESGKELPAWQGTDYINS